MTRRATSARIGRLAVLGASLVVSTAQAAVQSTEQQRCLNYLTKAGADVVRQQGKSNWKCLHNAARGKLTQLGEAGDTLTAQACLTNDVGGKVAQKQQRTSDRDAQYCQGLGAPGFAYAGAAAINAAASLAARDIVSALFGANLDAATVSDDVDGDGARCQEEVLKDANRIVDDMWRVARAAVQDGLKGRDRRAGASPDLAAHSGDNLAGEVLARAFEDAQGKIQGEVDRLAERAASRCGTATTPLAQMFPGSCGGAATIGALADCAADVARAHFYQALASTHGLAIECDLTDDGRHDESCISAGQRRHLLDRLAYGPDAYTIARLQALGLNGYIDEQLAPAAIDDSAVEAVIASRYPSLALNVVEVRDCYPQGGGGTCPGHLGGAKGDVWKDMEESEIYRAVASRRQLEAVLVDFWFNHFSVTGSAGQQKWNTPSYLRDSIRPWILGNFEDSVLRMARGPAMLDYLDQRLNQVGVPPGTGYNENFPRELLELHTMGVTGPYTEADVKEMARALTGWREEWNNAANFDPDYPGFRFQALRHDSLGPKTILGQVVNSGLEQEGFDAIRLAVRHASTAHFVCTKLVRRFVGDEPPFALIDRCATLFAATHDAPDQLRQVTALILKSAEFQLYPEYRRSKVKRPVVLMPSMLRAVHANPDPAVTSYQSLRNTLADLGERIRNAQPPTGYADISVVWASPGGMVQRFNLADATAATYAASWGVNGAGTDAQVVDGVAAVLFPVEPISTATRNAAIAYLAAISATPAQRVEQAGAFLLSSREFLTH
ncbi:MAG: DUF1800 domain-containing protein [Deltaproteobacteria bacterium]|nr:DUF1800 domain-containing protein [Deltaproteobacteria bacterium]